MIATDLDLKTELVQRLERGARLLFDLEERGECGQEYERWLAGWLNLLAQYESVDAA
jgi:hypothetical protein